MPISYLEISYPNFVLGAIIDPAEVNQNNHEFLTKINSLVTASNTHEANISNLTTIKADKTYVDNKFNDLAGAGRTTQTIKSNADNLISHKTSADHDTRYYTKAEINNTVSTLVTKSENTLKANLSDVYTRTQLNNGQLNNLYYTKTELNNGQLNNLYYTKSELTPWLRGGDTTIREDVFFIVNPNNGDGTFTYSINGQNITGTLGENGEQIFTLVSGYYEPGTNRIEAIINDTLRRSAKSGGLIEIDNTTVALTQPEGAGAEITFKYYERIGMTAEYNIKLSAEKPPRNDGKNMWFKVIG